MSFNPTQFTEVRKGSDVKFKDVLRNDLRNVLNINEAEILSLTEAVFTSLGRTGADTLTFSETFELVRKLAGVDNLTLNEVELFAVTKAVTEALALTETTLLTAGVNQNESLSVAEVVAAAVDMAEAETLGLNEATGVFGANMVFTVKTDNTGTSGSDQFTLPMFPGEVAQFDIDWGDGSSVDTITAWNDAALTHTFSGGAGTYTITIMPTPPATKPNFAAIRFNGGGDRLKILTIERWGLNEWTHGNGAFLNCSNLVLNATDKLVFAASLTSISNFFQGIATTGGVAHFDYNNLIQIDSFLQNATNFDEDMSATDWSKMKNISSALRNTAMNSPVPTNMGAGVNASSCFSSTQISSDMSSITFAPTNISNMFAGNTAMTTGFASWDVSGLTTAGSFAPNMTISVAEYDATLIAWAAQTVNSGVTISFGSSKYTGGGAAAAARATLVSAGWTITDGGIAP